MNNTDEILKMVQDEISNIIKTNPSMNTLINDMKNTIIHAMTKRGITIDDSINVAAKLIVLASMVK